MYKFVTAIVLIVVSILGFFTLAKPLFNEISTLKVQAAGYDQALTNAKSLESEKDKLTQKYNNMSPENLTRLSKLLPDNVDNIRLILEIGQVALPYGMILKDVKYDAVTTDSNTTVSGAVPSPDGTGTDLKDYGDWNLEFSTTGTYDNFIAFLKDLESNLRIIDISSISFSSDTEKGSNLSPSQTYTYDFKIKTYWLKN